MGLLINSYSVTPAGNDTDFASVILLAHVEGGVITEVIGGSTQAVVGAGVVSNARAKFGTESFLNNGTTAEGTSFVRYTAAGSYFVLPGPMTAEGWFYSVGAPAQLEHLWSTVDGIIAGAGDWGVQHGGSNITMFRYLGGSSYATVQSLTNSVIDNAWNHIAITRNALDRVDVWINGISRANGTVSGDLGRVISGNSLWCMGRGNNSDNMDWAQNWEEARLTKGVCRYTTTFTPPPAPFSDS